MVDIEATLDAELARGFFPGCVLAWGRKGGGGKVCCRGTAEREPVPRPTRDDSIFDLASLTKVVATATALGQILERGQLALGSKVVEFFPGYADVISEELQLRHLVTHSSGFDNTKPDAALSGEAALEDWLRIPVVAAPGARFEYACKNAVMVSLMIEAVTGVPFGDYCRESIFTPLGMNDTRFGPIPASARVVRCGNGPPGGISDEPARAIGRPVGNAGVFSTGADLARFARMMLNEGELDGVRILKPETVRLLTSVRSPKALPEFGVCWNMDRNPDEYHSRPASCSAATYGHSGYTGQSLWIDPQHGDYVVVLSNRLHAQRLSHTRDRQRFLTEANLGRVRIGEAALASMRTAQPYSS